ncbi:TonB-dependent receptor [Gluconacetobacter sacchari]|uniref:TonB-dependent receptor n=1 Tax=Gluconacetobacter sacchari TaxID=92759 RepID=UPI0039B3D3F8
MGIVFNTSDAVAAGGTVHPVHTAHAAPVATRTDRQRQSGSASSAANKEILSKTHEEIRVQSQSRRQKAQTIGETINVLSGAQLREFNVTTPTDIAHYIPGVNIAGSSAGQNLTLSIRGIVQQDFSPIAESPNAFYIDDGYVAAANSSSIGLFDVDNISVEKGPQGTDAGRNSIGGAIHITTRNPTLTNQGYVTVQYGSYNSARVEAAYGGPITHNLGFRVAGFYERNDAYWKNMYPGGADLGNVEKYGVRGKLQWQPTDRINILLTGVYSRQFSSWAPYLSMSTRNVIDNSGNLVNSIIVPSPTLLGTVPSSASKLEVDSDSAQGSGNHMSLYGTTLHGTYSGDYVSFDSITNAMWQTQRQHFDDDATPVDLFNTDIPGTTRTISQEFRLSHQTGRLTWQAGFYYANINVGVLPDAEMFPPVNIQSSYTLNTDAVAGFGQAAYHLTPSITVIGGIRIGNDHKTYNYGSEIFTMSGQDLGAARTSYSGTMSNTMVSAVGQVNWQAAKDLLVYGGYRRGQQAGGFNAPFAGATIYPDSQIPYKPETVNTWEIGEKAMFLNGKAMINASLFYDDFVSYQAFKLIGYNGSQVTNNPASFYGAEIDTEFKPFRGFTVRASGSYLDAWVKNTTISDITYNKRPPYTSKFHANVLAEYQFPMAGGQMSIQGNMSYNGTYYMSLTNFDSMKVPSYILVGNRLAWKSPSGWEVAFTGHNLADTRYKLVGFDLSGLCGCSQVAYGQPRWFEGSVTKYF